MEEKKAVNISQTVAVLIDGNNIEISIHKMTGNKSMMANYDTLVTKLVGDRSLNRLVYLREGKSVSTKLAERLHKNFYGVVKACYKNADIPLTIEAVQLADKVDTIIIMSGDSDYMELVKYLKAKGIRVEIAALKLSVSSVLVAEADYYHEITEEDCFTFT